jgi:hypothetical protein
MSKRKSSMPRGRPPLPPDKVRANRVVTFVTNPEMALLRQLSKKESDTISAICHRIIARYLNRYPAQPGRQGN